MYYSKPNLFSLWKVLYLGGLLHACGRQGELVIKIRGNAEFIRTITPYQFSEHPTVPIIKPEQFILWTEREANYQCHSALHSTVDVGEWSFSGPGYFTFGVRALGIYWVEGWVSLRPGAGAQEKRRICCLCWESSRGFLVHQPDWEFAVPKEGRSRCLHSELQETYKYAWWGIKQSSLMFKPFHTLRIDMLKFFFLYISYQQTVAGIIYNISGPS